MEVDPFTIAAVVRALDPGANSEDIVRKVQQIDLGLSAEDEIQAILTWLGRCSVCHRTDNVESHSRDFSKVRVPDIVAVFDVGSDRIPVAIEVKSTKDHTLRWSKSYYDSLKRYEDLTGLPVLVAWKHVPMRTWTLTALSSFESGMTGFHLTLDRSFKDSLLSILAGDTGYQLMDGVGLHIVGKKEEALKVEKDTEEWKVTITKAWFSDARGTEYRRLPRGIWPLFLGADITTTDKVGTETVEQHFTYDSTIPEVNNIQWLHRALPIIIRFGMPGNDRIPWRQRLKQDSLPISGTELRVALRESVETFTRYILSQRPANLPGFISEETASRLAAYFRNFEGTA